ncbi:MAG: coenzyme F420-0:L-glutamate ligase [Pseudomonadales bacterium]
MEHKLGFVHANAGIDQSNLPDNSDSETALLLPENPDKSARRTAHATLAKQCTTQRLL